MDTNPKESLCVGCKKVLRRMLFVCPSCKTSYCWLCWQKHVEDKICAYGKADTLAVAL